MQKKLGKNEDEDTLNTVWAARIGADDGVAPGGGVGLLVDLARRVALGPNGGGGGPVGDPGILS